MTGVALKVVARQLLAQSPAEVPILKCVRVAATFTMQCRGHCTAWCRRRRTACGVTGVAPRAVSWVLHRMWCRGHHTACGVAGIAPRGVADVA